MPDDRKGPAELVNTSPRPATARLLEAEAEADEIVRRAKKDAEEILAAARYRAKLIREAASSSEVEAAEVSQARAEVEKQKRLILEAASGRIQAMEATAAARIPEAVERLASLLVGES